MSDDAEVATRASLAHRGGLARHRHRRHRRRVLRGGESLPAALPNVDGELRIRGPVVERRVGGESPVGRRLQGVDWTEPSASFRVEVVFTELERSNAFRSPSRRSRRRPTPRAILGRARVLRFVEAKQGAYGFKGGPAFTPTTFASKGQLEVVIHWTQQCVPTVRRQRRSTTYTRGRWSTPSRVSITP